MTFESKFRVGDRVITNGKLGVVKAILITETGLRYRVPNTGSCFYLAENLEPAPQPEVWPKVDGPWVRYTDGPPAGYDSRLAERIAKLERLAWLLRQEAEVGLPTKHLLEKRDLRDYFAPYHGPNGEVYLEPQK